MDADAVLRKWSDRSGEFSPGYYAYYGPDETSEAIRDALDPVIDHDAAVLELGCSSGRHLSHLRGGGYRNLYGIDVNEGALAVMREAYPDLAAAGTFYLDAIENVVVEFPDDRFDAVYSAETLQHVHPDNEWVFEEVARIAGDLLVTAEIEGGDRRSTGVTYVDEGLPLYYRDWRDIFTALGFEEVASRDVGRDTLRVFRA